MKRIALFILVFVSSGVFAGNPVKRLLTGADSLLQKLYNKVDYDTTYISRSPGKMGLKAWANLSGSSFRARGDLINARLRADMKGTVSMEFDYYDLALELALNPTSFTGRNHDFELNFNFYPRRFIIDVSYQKAQTAAGHIAYNGSDIDVERGWLNTKMLNIDTYYTFNNKKFSYDAPFYQFYEQRKSAGTLMAGISYQGGSINTSDTPENIPQSKFGAQHIGLGCGYAYNLVAGRKWLIHLSVIPNIMLWSGNTIKMNGEKIDTETKFPTVLMNSRLGVVHYFSRRSFMGFSGIAQSLLKRKGRSSESHPSSLGNGPVVTELGEAKSTTDLLESKWMVRMFYGMRL